MADLQSARVEALLRCVAAPEAFEECERRLWKACFRDRLAASRAADQRGGRRARRRRRRSLGRAAAVYRAVLDRVGDAGDPRCRYACLVRLGDLARYANDPAAATARYEAAAALRPGDAGDAENALGVLAQREGHLLTAAYHYARGASCPRPSSAARKNLAAALRTGRGFAASEDRIERALYVLAAEAAPGSDGVADATAALGELCDRLSPARRAECRAILLAVSL